MINYKNYIGCNIKVDSRLNECCNETKTYKGVLLSASYTHIGIWTDSEKEANPEIVYTNAHVNVDLIASVKITKPARKLTMEEWQLYCMNVLGINLGGVSVTRKGFAIKGWQLDGETIISFDEEIDMLKIYKEEREK